MERFDERDGAKRNPIEREFAALDQRDPEERDAPGGGAFFRLASEAMC